MELKDLKRTTDLHISETGSWGNGSESVKNLLQKRKEAGYQPGSYSDNFKVGIVAEGGAMRGLISSAAVNALYQLGFGNCFDLAYGTSAGAINLAYFISGEINMGTSIYYENLLGKNFINVMNFFRRDSDIMDIHFLVDNWMKIGKRLSVEKIQRSPIVLNISATNAKTGKGKFFSSKQGRPEDIYSYLRASASAPIFSTHLELIDGQEYTDGMVEYGIPLDKAISDGCTHILCLLTKYKGFRKKTGPIRKLIESMFLHGNNEAFINAYTNRHISYNKQFELMANPPENVKVMCISPGKDEYEIGSSETRQPQLVRGAAESMIRTTKCFGLDWETLDIYSDK